MLPGSLTARSSSTDVYNALRHHVTHDDLFSATDGKFLWKVFFSDDKLDERETELLCQIKERIRAVNPDYEYLLSACLEARPKQGASGWPRGRGRSA